jgi:feruloyl esterase
MNRLAHVEWDERLCHYFAVTCRDWKNMSARSLPVLTCLLFAGLLQQASVAVAAAPGKPDRFAAVAPVMRCTGLRSTDLSTVTGANTAILEAAEVPGAAGYCRVLGRIEPRIRFEVHMPLSGWTQRFLQTGCGGLCGSLSLRLDDHTESCAPAAAGSLALASTDMGHEGGNDGGWAAADPQKKIDFGYRGVHLTALAAKALIRRFYGQPSRYAYFSGCSDGGREALMEAQRYPDDFNGIVAGAPALNFTVQNSFYHAGNALANTAADGHTILTANRLRVLHAAAIAACDARDGTRDGLISDPTRCDFDPHSVQCAAGQADDKCLSADEAGTASRIYAGARDAGGRKLVVGGPMPGSELSWAGVFVPENASAPIFSAIIADGSIRNLYYAEPLTANWTIRDLKFDAATLDSFTYRSIYDATNPDLTAFRQRGGRLIIWHGWSDPHISPLNSIEYYKAMQRQMGGSTVSDFTRLFLIPGLYHCGGGDGFTTFDTLTPLLEWVETGDAPAALRTVRAASPTNKTESVLNLLPYASKTTEAANWLGAKYMAPGIQQTCTALDGHMQCSRTL